MYITWRLNTVPDS